MASQAVDFLANTRRLVKLYESMLKEICADYQLTLLEATVVSFLYNHPGQDTAGDIVELRMLSKGNVSTAVESLIQKGLLMREQDTFDRRKIHLSLLEKASPITKRIDEVCAQYQKELFADFSAEEREQFSRLNDRILQNAKQAMIRRDRA